MTKFAVFTLALLLFAMPTVACVLPTATLTEAERECCRQMADKCGGTQMPVSHSCCQRLAIADDASYISTRSQPAFSDLVSVGTDLLPVALQTSVPPFATRVAYADTIHGPPEFPSVTTSVLRI